MFIDRIYIRRLKGNDRKQYLDFMINNGYDTKHFYKYALYKSKKMFIYKSKDTDSIIGIIAWIDNININKYIATPNWFILNVNLVYAIDADIFHIILNDITEYSLQHGQYQIHFTHLTKYSDILCSNHYIISKYDECIYCCIYKDLDIYHNYCKDIIPLSNARRIYSKEYDCNKNYNASDNIYI